MLSQEIQLTAMLVLLNKLILLHSKGLFYFSVFHFKTPNFFICKIKNKVENSSRAHVSVLPNTFVSRRSEPGMMPQQEHLLLFQRAQVQ